MSQRGPSSLRGMSQAERYLLQAATLLMGVDPATADAGLERDADAFDDLVKIAMGQLSEAATMNLETLARLRGSALAALFLSIHAFASGDVDGEFRWLLEAVRLGSPTAMVAMANLFLRVSAGSDDVRARWANADALELLLDAAALGSRVGMLRAAYLLKCGVPGVERDPGGALALLEQADAAGSLEAHRIHVLADQRGLLSPLLPEAGEEPGSLEWFECPTAALPSGRVPTGSSKRPRSVAGLRTERAEPPKRPRLDAP